MLHTHSMNRSNAQWYSCDVHVTLCQTVKTQAYHTIDRKMDILHSWPASKLIRVGVLEVLGTVLLCYVLAVVNGHVPVWLPFISDCGIYPPEKYPFRLGLVLGAALVAVQVLTLYYAERAFSKSRLCLVLGLVASAGLAVVAVVNSQEDDTIHTSKDDLYICYIAFSSSIAAAVIFFVGYDLYAILMTVYSWKDPKVSCLSLVIKVCLSVIANLSLIGYLLLSKSITKRFAKFLSL